MATATAEATLEGIDVDTLLFRSIRNAVTSSLTMCDTTARCVGVSTIPSHEPGLITGLIGVHGNVSGFITVNLAEQFALAAVGGLLQDKFDELTAQVVDGVGEITNLIVGGVKKSLASSPWAFTNITVPSVIVGNGYKLAFARGLEYLCVSFEHDNDAAVLLENRMMQVSISLLRL
jgi:chemotaxis protein CheX